MAIVPHYVDELTNRRRPPRFGAWNSRNCRFTVPGVPLKTFVIVNFTREPEHACRRFVNKLLRTLVEHGAQVHAREPYQYCQAPNDQDPELLRRVFLESGKKAYFDGGSECRRSA